MAPTKIVDTALSTSATDGRRMFTLSNGNALALTTDAQNVRVYETSAADRKTGWTLRATINTATLMPTGLAGVTAALFSNNDLAIIAWGQDGTSTEINYYKMTYSGYSVSAGAQVFAAISSTYLITSMGAMDIDVSDTGAVHIALMYSFGQIQPTLRTWVISSGGTILQTSDTALSTGVGNSAGDYICSIVSLGGANTAKRTVVAAGFGFYMSTPYTYQDWGIYVYTMTTNETTGAVGSALTFRYNITACNLTQPGVPRGCKNFKLFRTLLGTDAYHLGIMCGTSYENGTTGRLDAGASNKASYHRGSWDGTTWTNITAASVGIGFSSASGSLGRVGTSNRSNLGITLYDSTVASGDEGGMAFNFVGAYTAGGVTLTRIGVIQAVFRPLLTPGTGFWQVGQWVDNATDGTVGVFSGGNRNLNNVNKHDTLVYKSDLKPYHLMAPPTPVPTGVIPDNGQNVTTSTPDLSAVAQFTESYYAPATYTAEWQIAPDSTFTTGVRSYNQDSISTYQNFDGSSTTPKTITISTVTGYTPLTAGTWYIRSRLRDSYGGVSAWTTTTRVFTLGHPPTAIPLNPLNNSKFDYGAGTKTFSWDFTDPSPTDTQTAYQLRIRVSDSSGTIVVDTGKVSSSIKSATATIPSGNKNQTLYWEVKLWDTDDAPGLFSSSNSYFVMVDPATAAITAPTANQVLSAGTTTLSATVAATGGRVVKQYTYTIYKAGVAIWTSAPVLGSFGNGVAITAVVPAGVLTNTNAYSVVISVVDDAGINSISAPVSFTTSWTAALSATSFSASAANYNVEGSGYVQLSWVDANREAGFVSWRIYRSVDLIDPFTQAVISTGTYTLWKEYFGAQAGTYLINDYLAPSNQKVNYLIKQLANRGGFYVESENTTPASVIPISDAYWLFDMTDPEAPTSIRLGFTTSDSFTDEQEESEYTVIGRGRHVDKGEYLGPKGSVTIKLRGSTARQKRLLLLDYQNKEVPLYLRNPFGDVWKVNISSMQVGRLAGVGSSEFVDIEIPYSQVA